MKTALLLMLLSMVGNWNGWMEEVYVDPADGKTYIWEEPLNFIVTGQDDRRFSGYYVNGEGECQFTGVFTRRNEIKISDCWKIWDGYFLPDGRLRLSSHDAYSIGNSLWIGEKLP